MSQWTFLYLHPFVVFLFKNCWIKGMHVLNFDRHCQIAFQEDWPICTSTNYERVPFVHILINNGECQFLNFGRTVLACKIGKALVKTHNYSKVSTLSFWNLSIGLNVSNPALWEVFSKHCFCLDACKLQIYIHKTGIYVKDFLSVSSSLHFAKTGP